MKKYFNLIVVLVFLGAISGCASNKTRVAEGAAVGGGLGALAGGIIGHQTGSGVGGALIGGAIGATAGAAVGAQINKPAQEAQEDSDTQLTLQQIVDMTKERKSSDDIIAKIKSTNSKFYLTADDLAYLRKNGVSQRVIDRMQVNK